MTTPPPSPNPYAADATVTAPNTLARVSLVIAIVQVVLAIVLQIVSRLAPMIMQDLALGVSEIGILFAVFGFVSLVLGVFGLVFGLLGARRGDRVLEAGIGVGVGGFVTITSLVSLVSAPLLSLVY